MKVTFKGNTSKNKKFYPATADKPATLYVDVAEKIKFRDGTERTIWNKVKVFRNYAETIYNGLHGEAPVSRFIQVEGRIIDKPTVRMENGQSYIYNTVLADEITWLDNKYPENESGLPKEANAETEHLPEDVVEDETPWDEV